MKRSTINEKIRAAETMFKSAGLLLPEWAHWGVSDWRASAGSVRAICTAGLGWDLTDFGLGRFEEQGLLLFTVRNGTLDGAVPLPYAEKLMVVGDRQVTPMHFHWKKTEDIINRSGATLVIKVQLADRSSEQPVETPFTVMRDGLQIEAGPGTELRLEPGQSITLPPYLYHSFWSEGGACVVGEVSSVNDDATDNRFLEEIGRFPDIEDDAEPYRLLCTEYGSYISC